MAQLKRATIFVFFLSFLLTACDWKRLSSLPNVSAGLDTPQPNVIGLGAQSTDNLAKPLPTKIIDACATTIGLGEEQIALADPTNYGLRDARDYRFNHIPSRPMLIVLHETVMGEKETISLFKTRHLRNDDQVSYHLLIARDGRIIRVVPDANRAFGAGMSQFMGHTIRSKPGSVGSINNVALHVSLVSPPDSDDSDSHSGYTAEQYSALAKQVLYWQMKYGIPMAYVTTHYAVDRSHSRYDPRSFYWDRFDAAHRALSFACKVPYFSQPG